MKRRTLVGNVGIGFAVVAFFCVVVAFSTPSWLVSDYRISGAKLDRLGLWVHCFRSLADTSNVYQRRFFVGCRWVYDPFTKGYDEIRGFLLPGFMIATQFFYTLCFMGVLVSGIMVLIYFLCCGPDQSNFLLLLLVIGSILLGSGISGSIGVIVFAAFGNADGWMPGHDNNFFGWSFILAVIGAIACIVASVFFLAEHNVQTKKEKYFKSSQTRFELDESKA